MRTDTRPRAFSFIGLATAAEPAAATPDGSSPDFRASRLAARRAVRAALPGALEIRVARRSGAAASVSGTALPLALSLTHRDGRAAAIAAPAPARIGIDLECEDAIAPGHARYFLTTRERAAVGTHSLAALWALKEAAWKALALRGETCFHELELRIDEAGSLEAVTSRGETLTASATLARPWPGYIMATIQLDAVTDTGRAPARLVAR